MNQFFKVDPEKRFSLLLGPLLFIAVLLLLPNGLFDFKSRAAVATVFWMACWWITMPVSVGVTAPAGEYNPGSIHDL